MNKIEMITEPTNGAEEDIGFSAPYSVELAIKGTCDLLFHRWNPDAVDEKARSAKGSKAKKTDNIETYVYRLESGELAMPAEYLRQSICEAARFRQDPRSPRKSAQELFEAAFVPTEMFAGLGKKKWDYEDRRRAVVQRQGINRTRPAFRVGWKAAFTFMVILPEYVPADVFRATLSQAGRVIGVGDFRPTFGRFVIDKFKVI